MLLFKTGHNLLLNNNINKNLSGALDNNLNFEFYNLLIHYNIKSNSTQLKLVIKNLPCMCVRQKQHMWVLYY